MFILTIVFYPKIVYTKDTKGKGKNEMKKSFYIYWGENRISCFVLKSEKQAKSIAKQYPNVTKIECKIYNKKGELIELVL